MSQISFTEDIRSVTELKRNTREILDQLHATGRPIVLTVNGKANSVLMDVHVYEKHIQAVNLARLLAPALDEVKNGKARPARLFLTEFKRAKKISG